MTLVLQHAEIEPRGGLPGTPNLGETVAESIAKLLFDLGSDEPDRVHVLDVNLVLEAETGELHLDQVGDRSPPRNPLRSVRWAKSLARDSSLQAELFRG